MPGAFDMYDPPAPDLIDRCVHCGFCLQACPTYVLWHNEMDSPRGRIYLMKMASEGAAAITPRWVEHFDTCLGCMSCMTACPSGVDYGNLIAATRAQIERQHQRSRGERLYRWLILNTFPRPDRLRLMRALLSLYRNSGLQALVSRFLPARLRSMQALLPKLEKRAPIPEVTPAQTERRVRVGLILGCVQREFLSEINAAAARVLAAEGCEVVAPSAQPCCGALLTHAGHPEPAMRLARAMIEQFESAGVDFIVNTAGGCGSHLKEYGHVLRNDPKYAERAKKFSAQCKDIAEFLADLPARAVRHPLTLRVAYHDSCHLQHAQRIRTQPRSLLAAIPGLSLENLAEAPLCCGSAGIYNLVEPDTATELGDRKARHISALHPDAVATGNAGCLMQLRAGLARTGDQTPVLHTIQILDASIRNTKL